MYTENEQIEPIRIRSADDAWSAMYEHGIKQSLGEILGYFLSCGESEDFIRFCHSLDEEQLKEALDYFFTNFNQNKFAMFFNSLNSFQQTAVVSILLNDACRSNSKSVAYCSSVIQLRKRLSGWKQKLKMPRDVNEAVSSARNNSFDGPIHYLWRNPEDIKKFVGQLNNKSENIVLGGFALEIMSYLPHTYGSSSNEENLPFAA